MRLKTLFLGFWGPEYVTPSAMASKYFNKLVVQYDRDLIGTVKKNGNSACVHCHGKIRAISKMIKNMKPDILEPIEPPPHGDVTLKDLKNKLGDDICLMSHIEYDDIISSEPITVRKIVKKTIREGAPGWGYIMISSSIPIKTLLPVMAETNLMKFLKAGKEYDLYQMKQL